MQEKFSITAVAMLRSNLIHCGLDSFQVAESIKMFVAKHGYGLPAEQARDVATQLERTGYKVESLHHQLETFALMM